MERCHTCLVVVFLLCETERELGEAARFRRTCLDESVGALGQCESFARLRQRHMLRLYQAIGVVAR